jgi:hypothetical protein
MANPTYLSFLPSDKLFKFIAEPTLKIFLSERNSFLNLSAPVLNFSGNEGKIFTFKPAQKSAGSAIKISEFEHPIRVLSTAQFT